MAVKAHVQQALGRFGYQLVRMPPEGSLAREIQRVIVHRDITTVLDVGGHVGAYGQGLRDIGFGGRIVSFEPAERPFRELQGRVHGSWQAIQVALGDADGSAELHEYAEHEELSSLRAPSDYGRKHFGLTLVRTTTVPVRRLDDLALDLEIVPRQTLLKIDTQGHELAVMAGAPILMASVAALQLEVPMFGLYEGAPSPTSMIKELLDTGFNLLGLFPVHAHPRPLVPVEFDGLFARGYSAPSPPARDPEPV